MDLLKKASLMLLVCSVGLSVIFSDVSQNEQMNIRKETTDETPLDDITPKRGKYSPTAAVIETSSTSASGWYCMHMKNGERPPIPSEMSYIENYGGYYIGKDEKVIYLTFDAGYDNGNIEKILDTLKEENVPAAFFILEHLAEKNTDLVDRMFNEGHTVCNHTAMHKDMTKMASIDEFKAELDKMEEVCREYTGKEMAHYFRPPEGKVSEQELEWANELGYKTIMWSYAYADWDNNNQMSYGEALKKVLDGTHNGEVLLLHPTSATNAEILPELIKTWKEMGYRFGTLDELTGDEL